MLRRLARWMLVGKNNDIHATTTPILLNASAATTGALYYRHEESNPEFQNSMHVKCG